MGMRVLESAEFKRRVARLVDLDFCRLGIEPCEPLGGFRGCRREELKKFCTTHPQYHIVSLMPNFMYVNHCADDALLYFLAQGDADDSLVGVRKSNPMSAFYLID